MPNPVVGMIGAQVASTAISANQASNAAEDAVNASERATDRTVGESGRQFDTVREDTRIARETGDDALMTLGFLLGVRQSPTDEDISELRTQLREAQKLRKRSMSANSQIREEDKPDFFDRLRPDTRNSLTLGGGLPFPDLRRGDRDGAQRADIGAIDDKIANIQKRLDQARRMQEISMQYAGGIGDFIKSQPGYEFGLQQGQQALTNQLSASGQSMGGKAFKAASRFGIDYASSKTDEHLSRLFTLAGYGPAGVNTSANAGANYANTVAGAQGRHAGVVGDAAYGVAGTNIAALNNGLNTGMSLWTYNDYMNRTQPQGG